MFEGEDSGLIAAGGQCGPPQAKAARRHGRGEVCAGRDCVLAVVLIAAILAGGGCGTLEDGRGWGEDVVLRADGERFGRAVHNAFWDWQTVGPLVGAGVFAIGDLDDRTSDWATKHNPIFGSDHDARDASDDLKDALWIEMVATALVTPSGDEAGEWAFSKAKGLVVELGAVRATRGATSGLKSWTSRQRPDESDDRSFPSGHASEAFSLATLSNRNLDYIDVPCGLRRPLQVGNILAASGVAWARVEGRRHYPSDVLFAAALGHFVSTLIHDYFLDLPETNRFDFRIIPYDKGAFVELTFAF
jgi:hypothetical protein